MAMLDAPLGSRRIVDRLPLGQIIDGESDPLNILSRENPALARAVRMDYVDAGWEMSGTAILAVYEAPQPYRKGGLLD